MLIAVGFASVLRGRGGSAISRAAGSGVLDEGAPPPGPRLSQDIGTARSSPGHRQHRSAAARPVTSVNSDHLGWSISHALSGRCRLGPGGTGRLAAGNEVFHAFHGEVRGHHRDEDRRGRKLPPTCDTNAASSTTVNGAATTPRGRRRTAGERQSEWHTWNELVDEDSCGSADKQRREYRPADESARLAHGEGEDLRDHDDSQQAGAERARVAQHRLELRAAGEQRHRSSITTITGLDSIPPYAPAISQDAHPGILVAQGPSPGRSTWRLRRPSIPALSPGPGSPPPR